MAEQLVYFNGRFLPAGEVHLPLLTHGLHYGTGVFEGIRAYYQPDGGELLLFRATDHFDRMARNVRILQMTLPLPPAELTEVGAELIRLNAFITDVYLRPIAFKSATRVGVTLPAEESFAMIAVPMGDYLDTHKGLHCGVSSWRRLSDNAIPCRGKICGAYVNSALAAQEARDRGFDEAIFLNEAGAVAEGSAMNLFLVREGRLVTPDVTQGILEGITRDTIITLAREEMGIDTETRVVSRAELYVADEVFLCGTAAQIAPVTRIDGRPIGAGEPGPLTIDLQAMYDGVVRGRLPQYRRWNEPVYRYARTRDAQAVSLPGGR
ncbi:MAG TPA: branched-chain amino acid transaminase [Candidatus Polarisedimenticolia bacterium]|nr:branched-chain amino acid transaminase [Candidatus Polarisedimenticolia bacterium]